MPFRNEKKRLMSLRVETYQGDSDTLVTSKCVTDSNTQKEKLFGDFCFESPKSNINDEKAGHFYN